MFKKHFKTTFALLSFILLTLIIVSTAFSGTLFGPKQYIRTSGAPNTYTDTFQSKGGRGTLAIKNGDANGDNRATSAVVYLNGKEIFGPNNFKKSVYTLEKSVDLNNGTNTLNVELRSKPGSYLTVEISGNVISPPTVTISANPSSVNSGASSTLTWSSTNATSCSINQGIGPVTISGTINVIPTQTTTYTITATGVGGTTIANVTVTVLPPPTVTLNAAPAAISQGQSSMLSWTSTNATTCSINQGIGTVATSGSTAVAPAQTTTYTITASGPGGTTQAAITVIVSTVSKIDLTITSPADGASVTGSSVMVTGTVNNSFGYETGVTVNGAIATVSDNTFVVNHVPMTAGQNTITVAATDANGKITTKTITVNATIPDNYIKLSANPDSGVAPLVVTLTINGSFSVANPIITPTGPGTVEQLASDNPNVFKYKMTTAGIYYFTAQATGPDGNTYSDTLAVTVLTLAQLDTLLRTKWAVLSTALTHKDISTALTLMLPSSRDRYQTMFSLLTDQLPAIVATQTELILDSIAGNFAFYELKTLENGSVFSYRVIFAKDRSTGLWLIQEF